MQKRKKNDIQNLLELGHVCLPCVSVPNISMSSLLCRRGAQSSFQNVQRLSQSRSQRDLEIIFHTIFLQANIANRLLLYINIKHHYQFPVARDIHLLVNAAKKSYNFN